MFKKIVTFFMALLVAFQPMVAGATDLNAAFGNLLGPGAAVSVNQPGGYQSGARNSFVAGGLEMRVPRPSSSPQLFSVTPPRVTAGCNGISAHFGGFSFISGAEFEKMLKSIASGAALGFVSMMVMKVMCPPCEAVVQFLKSAAQAAARLSKDSCQWGQEMAQKFHSGDISIGSSTSICGATVASDGGSNDWLSAMSDACKSTESAVNTIKDMNADAAKTPEGAANLDCKIGAGNTTWQRLTAFDTSGTNAAVVGSSDDYRRKLLLLNLLGTTINHSTALEGAGCTNTGGVFVPTSDENPSVYCPPTLSPQDAIGLFLCGSPDSLVGEAGKSIRVAEYCKSFFENTKSSIETGGALSGLKNTQVYACDNNNFAGCTKMSLQDSNVILSGQGFLVHVNSLLRQGVAAVRDDTKMPDDVIRLMQVAPYPLYQAINAAAVYPAAADDLLDSMSILVAEQAAVAYLDDTLRLQGRPAGQPKGCMTSEQATRILDTIGQMRAGNKARVMQMGQNMAIQEGLSEQIRQINMTIQKQVMSQDMLATGRYAEQIGRALNPNVSQGGAAAPAPAPTTP